MKTLAAATAASGILLLLLGPNGGAAPATSTLARAAPPDPAALLHPTPSPRPIAPPASADLPPETLTEVVRRVCGLCHNDAPLTGNLSLEKFDVAKAPENAQVAEKMIAKLRAGMMPPPGIPRPGG